MSTDEDAVVYLMLASELVRRTFGRSQTLEPASETLGQEQGLYGSVLAVSD